MTVIDTNTNCMSSTELLRGKGVTAVGRYYRVVHPEWRLTKAEAERLSAAGIKLFTVYEDTGHNLTLTTAQGKIDGQNALEQATQVGQPQGTAIYFALEGLPSGYVESDLPAVRKYFAGVKQAIGSKYERGVYSNGLVCETLLDEDICSYTWLSASKSFAGTRDFYRTGRWNLSQTTPLDQNWNGLSVDVDEAKQDFGAFIVPGASAVLGAPAAAGAPIVAAALQGVSESTNFYCDYARSAIQQHEANCRSRASRASDAGIGPGCYSRRGSERSKADDFRDLSKSGASNSAFQSGRNQAQASWRTPLRARLRYRKGHSWSAVLER
jgi:hypothetical protein